MCIRDSHDPSGTLPGSFQDPSRVLPGSSRDPSGTLRTPGPFQNPPGGAFQQDPPKKHQT
eukprot:9533186-Karenia_brevis.AAC.1